MPETKRPLPLHPAWDKVQLAAGGARAVGVDREQRKINGYVVALGGPFKNQDRGEFDQASLQSIVQLMSSSSKGLKSRFTHPSLSNDGLGSYLGRSTNPRLATAMVDRNGQPTEVQCVRADLQLSATAFEGNPKGDLGSYVMDLVEEDSDALSSSLVLKYDPQIRLEENGSRKLGVDGKPLAPIWKPTKLFASDLVDEGEAVDGLLSASLVADGELPDEAVRLGSGVIDRAFAGQSREVVATRCGAFLERYLSNRFGEVAPTPATEKAWDQLGLLLMKQKLRDKAFSS